LDTGRGENQEDLGKLHRHHLEEVSDYRSQRFFFIQSKIIYPNSIYLGIEGDEGGIMLESFVSTGKTLPFMVEHGQIRWALNKI
jgi:hypothetical protein